MALDTSGYGFEAAVNPEPMSRSRLAAILVRMCEDRLAGKVDEDKHALAVEVHRLQNRLAKLEGN